MRIFLPDFLNKFNDSIIDVPAEDMYYLLQTCASMALAREIEDFEFINRITIDLFKVSILNNAKIIWILPSLFLSNRLVS